MKNAPRSCWCSFAPAVSLAVAALACAGLGGCAARQVQDRPPVEPLHMPTVVTSSSPTAKAPAIPATPRLQREAILRELYARYRGGADALAATGDTGAGTGDDEARAHNGDVGDHKQQLADIQQHLGGSVDEADRAAFAQQCTSVGKGAQPEWAGNQRAERFFARSDVRAQCVEVARLAAQAEGDRSEP